MLKPKRLKSIFLSATSKHLELAQDVRGLYIYPVGWGGSPAYPGQAKKGTKEQDSLPRCENQYHKQSLLTKNTSVSR